MQTSRVIEVDGVFVGVAVLLPDVQGWRFVAADARAQAADGAVAASVRETQLMAKRAFLAARGLVFEVV